MYAAERGFLDGVKVLAPLEAGMQTDFGSTAMMYAAQGGHVECVKELI